MDSRQYNGEGREVEGFHVKVLQLCLPELLKRLDPVCVLDYIGSKEIMNQVTIRDIRDQTTTSDKTRKLIQHIQQLGDESVYQKFKDCLEESGQSHVKDVLENEEKKQNEVNPVLTAYELQKRIEELEGENQQLLEENQRLKQKLEMRTTVEFEDTPKKVEFPRKLADFGKITGKENRPRPYQSLPVRRLVFNNDESNRDCSHVEDLQMQSSEMIRNQEPADESWKECVTGSGEKNEKLIPHYDVFITQGKLSNAMLAGSESPRKMVIALLGPLFSKEVLAKSSAKGSRNAHNASTKTQPLPALVLCAIKEFTLNSFKKKRGQPCLTDTAFNDAVNSKCATARRSLKLLR